MKFVCLRQSHGLYGKLTNMAVYRCAIPKIELLKYACHSIERMKRFNCDINTILFKFF